MKMKFELVDTEQAAKIIGVSGQWVTQLARTGKLTPVIAGRKGKSAYIFEREEVEAFAAFRRDNLQK